MGRSSQARYALVLTGRRTDGRHCVLVRGKSVWLTSTLFEVLCTLVAARAVGEGFATVSRWAIHRIRQAIGDRRLAAEIFQRGGPKEYRVGWTPRRIAVDESFSDLPSPQFLPANVRDTISKSFDRIGPP